MASETDKNLDEILAAVMGVDPDDRAPDLEDMRARAAGPLAYEVVRLRALLIEARARVKVDPPMSPVLRSLITKLRDQRGAIPSQDSLADQLGRVGKVLAEHGIKDRAAQVQVANAMGEYDAADYIKAKPTVTDLCSDPSPCQRTSPGMKYGNC
jgi:hypothetical protein